MLCTKTGFNIYNKDIAEGIGRIRTRSGDRFTCPLCSASVVVDLGDEFGTHPNLAQADIDRGSAAYGDA